MRNIFLDMKISNFCHALFALKNGGQQCNASESFYKPNRDDFLRMRSRMRRARAGAGELLLLTIRSFT
jgi:hypothetical protein